MVKSCCGWYWRLGLASLLTVGGMLVFSSKRAWGQVTGDNTLGAESSQVTSQNPEAFQIEGGATRGANLFHSFEQFSVPTGGTAYFSNALDIQNIISRVTGASVSNIDGLLRANGAANLFLLNPNGIIFGPKASLSIGGSFVGSTASSLNFADGTQFSATVAQNIPLLTVSVPIGLHYGGTVGDIQVQQSTLYVKTGQTLALIGGNVSVEGGLLSGRGRGGRVELGGVSRAGTVGLNININTVRLSFPAEVARADVSLTNNASVYAESDERGSGGSIAITARNLDIAGESLLEVGGIEASFGSFNSSAGDMEINATGAITMTDGSLISAVTTAQNLIFALIDEGLISDSNVQLGAVGNGGSVNITTGSLSVTNGAQLFATTFRQGNAGNITIHARDTVSFDGVVSRKFNILSFNIPSGVYSNLQPGAVGNGGSVNITTGSLSVTNGAQLSTSTFGQGNAGRITIHARDTVSFDGMGSGEFSEFNSGASSSVSPGAVGNGGSVNITTGSLSVTNGAQLSTSTFGQGNAGRITIHARDTVSFDGVDSSEFNSSGAYSGVQPGAVGNGGSVNITAGALSVTDGAGVAVNSLGSGDAGNLDIAARSIRLDNQAILLAESELGRGGNITLQTRDLLLMRHSSLISAISRGGGSAGNIAIDTGILASVENSDIIANAFAGPGANIQITAFGIFGTQSRESLTPESDITATGVVELVIPDVNPSSGLVNLPSVPIDTKVVQACTPGGSQQQSEFIITGRGGLPPNPGDALSTDAVMVDFITLNPGVEDSSSPDVSTNPISPPPTQIVEAQGWVINNKGEVVLTAQAPTVIPHIPWLPSTDCPAPESSS